jgi:hypothetical protein
MTGPTRQSDAPPAPTGTVLEFDVPEKRSDTVPRMAFKINGEEFVLKMPKLAPTAGILAMIQDDDLDVRKHGARLASAMLGLIDYIELVPSEPAMITNPAWFDGADDDVAQVIPNPKAGQMHGRLRIHQRLSDPDDGMDMEHLAPIFKMCIQTMFKRPTGPSPESSPQQANGGSDSAEATSEPQDEMSSI